MVWRYLAWDGRLLDPQERRHLDIMLHDDWELWSATTAGCSTPHRERRHRTWKDLCHDGRQIISSTTTKKPPEPDTMDSVWLKDGRWMNRMSSMSVESMDLCLDGLDSASIGSRRTFFSGSPSRSGRPT